MQRYRYGVKSHQYLRRLLMFTYIAFALGNFAIAFVASMMINDARVRRLLFAYVAIVTVAGCVCFDSGPSRHLPGAPNLGGSDGESYYLQAASLARHGILQYSKLISSNYVGQQIYLALWFRVLGVSLPVALLANNFCLVLSVVAIHRTTVILTNSCRASEHAVLAFMLTTAHIYSTLALLKEPALVLAVSLVGLTAAESSRPAPSIALRLLYCAASALIMATMRAPFLVLFALVFGLSAHRMVWKRAMGIAIGIAALLLIAPYAQNFSAHKLNVEYVTDVVARSDFVTQQRTLRGESSEGIVATIGGQYVKLPFLLKLGLFCIPTGMQVFLPVDFWSDRWWVDHPSFVFLINLNPLWYLFVVVWVLFALWNMKLTRNFVLSRLLLAGVLFYVMVAVVYAGAIPRYALPAVTLMYPAVGYWWYRSLSDGEIAIRARVFFRRYYLTAGALGILYGLLIFSRMV